MPRPPSTLLSLSQSQGDPTALASLSNSCSELESSSDSRAVTWSPSTCRRLNTAFFSFRHLLSHCNFDDITLRERTPRWLIYFDFTHRLLLKELKNRAGVLAPDACACAPWSWTHALQPVLHCCKHTSKQTKKHVWLREAVFLRSELTAWKGHACWLAD